MVDHSQEFFKPGISASSFSDYFKSPRHFWANSSFNPERVKKPSTEALDFGKLTHCLILNPETFDAEFIVSPKINRRTKAGKQEYQDFLATVGKRTAIEKSDLDLATAMRDAMFRNSAVRQLIGNGMSESPVTWKRDDGDLMCKVRLDYARNGLTIEYKTTENAHPEAFAKSLATYGYHRQKAWQRDGYKEINGEYPRGSIIIAQDKVVHDAIAIYALDDRALASGKEETDTAYRDICKRMTTGNWEAYPARIVPLSLPNWYKTKGAANE